MGWQKTFGGTKNDEATSIIKDENGYLIVGWTESFGKGYEDAWLIKIDKKGNKIWDKTFGGTKGDVAKIIIKDKNGYVIAGWTKSFGKGKKDVWVIKFR